MRSLLISADEGRNISAAISTAFVIAILSNYCSSSEMFLSYFLSCLILFLIVAVLVINKFKRNHFDLFESINFVMFNCFVLFFIKSIFVIEVGSMYFDLSIDTDLKAFNLALIYSLLWMIIFILSYYSRFPNRIYKKIPRLPELSISRLKFWLPILIVMSASAATIKMGMIGGIKSYVLLPETAKAALGTGYISIFELLLPASYLLSLNCSIKFRQRIFFVYTIISGSIWFFLAVLVTFSKGGVFNFTALTLIIVLHNSRIKINFKKILSFGVIIFISVGMFIFIENWRMHSGSINLGDSFVSNVYEQFLITREAIESSMSDSKVIATLTPFLRREGIEALTIIIRDTYELMPLETLRDIIISPIPRVLWDAKPYVSEGVTFGHRYLGAEGIAAYATTMPGSGYTTLGVVGVILNAWFASIVVRIMYNYCIKSNNIFTGSFVYSILFMRIGYFTEVGIVDFISGFIPLVLDAALIVFLTRKRPTSTSHF